MKDILDHEELESSVSYADKAFIYFKWVAVFFAGGLCISYFQVKGDIHPRTAGYFIAIMWFVSLLLVLPCGWNSIQSFRYKEGISYKNIAGILICLWMLGVFGLVIFANMTDIIRFAS